MILNILFISVVTSLGMIGGQLEKGVRRFGIPGITLTFSMFELIGKMKNKKDKLKYFCFGLMIPILCMGYGVNSWLMKTFKKDWIVRLAYGVLLSIPYGIFLLLKGAFGLPYIICIGALCGAWSIRAGKLGKIGTFDILIEDIVRYATVGTLIVYTGGL